MSLSPFLLAALAPFLSGIAGTVVTGRVRSRAIPGLLFHSIGTASPVTMSALPRRLFDRIIRGLFQDGFRSVTISDRRIDKGKKPLLITFDDGCRSFLQHALPVLSECGFRITLFPVAGYLGKSSTWDILPSFSHLTAVEVKEISAMGHEIGSHTFTHPDLTFLGKAELVSELKDSKQLLEDAVGKVVTAISFPFGSWNRRIWDCARECGYTHATIYRNHGNASDSLFPVHGVYRFDTAESVLARTRTVTGISLSAALAGMMSHFARGAPLWRFRNGYDVAPQD